MFEVLQRFGQKRLMELMCGVCGINIILGEHLQILLFGINF